MTELAAAAPDTETVMIDAPHMNVHRTAWRREDAARKVDRAHERQFELETARFGRCKRPPDSERFHPLSRPASGERFTSPTTLPSTVPLSADRQSLAGPVEHHCQSVNRCRDLAICPDGKTIHIASVPGGLTGSADGGVTDKVTNSGAILVFTSAGQGQAVR